MQRIILILIQIHIHTHTHTHTHGTGLMNARDAATGMRLVTFCFRRVGFYARLPGGKRNSMALLNHDPAAMAVGRACADATKADEPVRLDLGLLAAVLPDDDVGGDTILAVVEEDDAGLKSVYMADASYPGSSMGGALTGHRGSWTRQCRTRGP